MTRNVSPKTESVQFSSHVGTFQPSMASSPKKTDKRTDNAENESSPDDDTHKDVAIDRSLGAIDRIIAIGADEDDIIDCGTDGILSYHPPGSDKSSRRTAANGKERAKKGRRIFMQHAASSKD